MNRIRAGLIVAICGWLLSMINPITGWISIIDEKIKLDSGYEITKAEIILDEADYEEVGGYKKVTLKYTANDEIIEKHMSKEEYRNNEYAPFINGGLINVMYEKNAPENIEVVVDNNIVSSTVWLLVTTVIFIYIVKKIYPEVVRRYKKEYSNQEYIDAQIISSDSFNRIIAIDDSEEKIRVFKSFPYFNAVDNMGTFLKSKNIEKIRVYFNESDEKKITMDYKVLSEVKTDD